MIPLGFYTHYKGNKYEVIAVAYHSETLEPMVIYRPLNTEQKLWARPLGMFMESVTVDGKTVPRFALNNDS